MTVVQIQMNKPVPAKGLALFNLGFRPFFLGAAIFAVVSIGWWMVIYSIPHAIQIQTISPSQWHAHEMLYGYGMAVVAGFLLTAIKNWTAVTTIHGKPLAVLFGLWCAARVFLLFGTHFLLFAAIADLAFGLWLLAALAAPIVRAKQWRQMAVVGKVMLLVLGNVLFYMGSLNLFPQGMVYAIDGAVLLFISLILMIGRRVIPFFIERGVGYKIVLKQHRWLDISILVVFTGLFINLLFFRHILAGSTLALSLFFLNGFRLINWHTHGIWHVPLLWSLYLSSWLVNFGFLLYGLQHPLNVAPVLTIHVFTLGGIGLMTIAMMSRVALGHTGRDIRKPSRWLNAAFLAVAISVWLRVGMPLLWSEHYVYWVRSSALFWMIGFTIFVVIYTPILLKQRIDGSFG